VYILCQLPSCDFVSIAATTIYKVSFKVERCLCRHLSLDTMLRRFV
jgi:hypothetical protein